MTNIHLILLLPPDISTNLPGKLRNSEPGHEGSLNPERDQEADVFINCLPIMDWSDRHSIDKYVFYLFNQCICFWPQILFIHTSGSCLSKIYPWQRGWDTNPHRPIFINLGIFSPPLPTTITVRRVVSLSFNVCLFSFHYLHIAISRIE